jgi:hypothetical protein
MNVEDAKKPEFVQLDPPENSRTYKFPGGESVTLTNVTAICIRKSGMHRLETSNGLKHIVPPGWLHIVIEVADWTF